MCIAFEEKNGLMELIWCRAKVDDNPTFFGDGLLAGSTTPKITGKGIRRIVKVIDDQMLSVTICSLPASRG